MDDFFVRGIAHFSMMKKEYTELYIDTLADILTQERIFYDRESFQKCFLKVLFWSIGITESFPVGYVLFEKSKFHIF